VTILKTTQHYERWLREQIPIVRRDLLLKHRSMHEGPFTLLRATFYRWMEHWQSEKKIEHLRSAPEVLAVGDLHVENFGTWRDAEGRLVWGLNDFDEAYPLPFTLDLVRLATSAHLAIAESGLSVGVRDSCDAILQGYSAGIEEGGQPFVLSERNIWLWRLAMNNLRNPKRFWREQEARCSRPGSAPPRGLVAFVRARFPRGAGPIEVLHRTAGRGSLGRQRYLFRTEWEGSVTTREAKPLVPSACAWASGERRPQIWYDEIVRRAIRCHDPFASRWRNWVIRRLAPDSSKIDLAHLPRDRDETKLLWAMGFETANIHLGTPRARRAIAQFLRGAPARWLDRASQVLAGRVARDSRDWR
jgi:Uncharacterized protein conserved in bacteria (DUF2252)